MQCSSAFNPVSTELLLYTHHLVACWQMYAGAYLTCAIKSKPNSPCMRQSFLPMCVTLLLNELKNIQESVSVRLMV